MGEGANHWREGVTLHHGDYRETLALCGGAADLVLTSPPYCDARTYGANVRWEMPDYAALGDAVFAALRPGGPPCAGLVFRAVLAGVGVLLRIDRPVRPARRAVPARAAPIRLERPAIGAVI